MLLRAIALRVQAAGFEIGNVDCTVVTEAPKLAPLRDEMEKNLSAAIDAPVTVKATRPEALGALGRGEGLACLAVALIVERERALMPPRPAERRPLPARVRAAAARARSRARSRRRRRPRAIDRGLGGQIVAGRNAVRELLAAGRRPVREIFFAEGIDPAPVLDDIASLRGQGGRADPHAARGPVSSSSPRPKRRKASSRAPRRYPKPTCRRSPRPTRPGARRRSLSRSTASPIRTTSAPSSAAPSRPARPVSCLPATAPPTSPRR